MISMNPFKKKHPENCQCSKCCTDELQQVTHRFKTSREDSRKDRDTLFGVIDNIEKKLGKSLGVDHK